MKKFLELVNEVATAVSPADKEFVALHRIVKTQRVAYPEHQFKGGTQKDHSKMTLPSDEMGVESAAEKEKPVNESWRAHKGEPLEEATPSSTGLTSRHLEKALHNGGYTDVKIKSSKFVKDAGKSGHKYHAAFGDGTDGHIYVSKDEKGVHKAEF